MWTHVLSLISATIVSHAQEASLDSTSSVSTSSSPFVSETSTSSSTMALITNTTVPPFVPVSPASKAKYRMALTNSGPAILDSNVYFEAQLQLVDKDVSEHLTTEFVYHWMNLADMTVYETYGGLTSQLTIYFSSQDRDAGEYLMTVSAVFKKDPTKMAAFQVTKFTLTEKLNGHLILQQDMSYTRFPNVFATNQDVMLFAEVQDHFRASYNMSYSFYWYEGEHYLQSSHSPLITTSVKSPSNFTLMAVILAEISYSSKEKNNTQEKNWILDKNVQNQSSQFEKKVPKDLDKDEGLKDEPYLKDGQFTLAVSFKDPLEDCVFLRVDAEPGERSVKLGSEVVLNITCWGSAPSSVCFFISAFNETIPANHTCQPGTFFDTVHHQVKIQLNTSGWSDVHFSVYNDVSVTDKVISYFAYNSDSVNVPALVFPTVFGVLGVAIMVLGAVYMMRLRKKPQVEVADFDFHPSLTTSTRRETGVGLARLTNSLRYMFHRARCPPPRPQDHGPQGLEEESEQVKALYGSL